MGFIVDGFAPGIVVPTAFVPAGYGAKVRFLRPNDSTAYGAADVVNTSSVAANPGYLIFPNMGPVGGGEIMITSTMMEHDETAAISGETSYTLHLYSAIPASAFVDNTAWDLGTSGDRVNYLGAVPLGTLADVGSTMIVFGDGLNRQLTLPASSNGNLYGYLLTDGAYTPVALDVYTVALHSIRI